jgi:hypothetical protein
MPGKPAPAIERFWRFVNTQASGCWLWTGGSERKGYGRFRDEDKKLVSAHRWAYEYFVEMIPKGMQTDHLCNTPACVNPDHLELVTNLENQKRAASLRTHCPHGHLLDGKKAIGIRYCKTCSREYQRKYQKEKSNVDQ